MDLCPIADGGEEGADIKELIKHIACQLPLVPRLQRTLVALLQEPILINSASTPCSKRDHGQAGGRDHAIDRTRNQFRDDPGLVKHVRGSVIIDIQQLEHSCVERCFGCERQSRTKLYCVDVRVTLVS